MSRNLIIGSRGSKLALWQAHYLQDQLKSLDIQSEIKVIKTRGDNIQDIGFSKMEGKGFFTKEIEEELLNATIDVAVHSMKDLPTTHPDGLVIAGVSYREDPSDTIVIHKDHYDESQPMWISEGTIIGTSSARRKAMLRDLLGENIKIKDIRGNVPTRIKKLFDEDFGAIILASAGIARLQISVEDAIVKKLHPREFIPAPAQGVLAYQTREDDIETRKIFNKLNNDDVARRTNVERKVLNMLDGGCQLPLGVYVEKDANGNFHAHAALAQDGDTSLTRVTLGQSTTAGMAEKIYELLKEKK